MSNTWHIGIYSLCTCGCKHCICLGTALLLHVLIRHCIYYDFKNFLLSRGLYYGHSCSAWIQLWHVDSLLSRKLDRGVLRWTRCPILSSYWYPCYSQRRDPGWYDSYTEWVCLQFLPPTQITKETVEKLNIVQTLSSNFSIFQQHLIMAMIFIRGVFRYPYHPTSRVLNTWLPTVGCWKFKEFACFALKFACFSLK